MASTSSQAPSVDSFTVGWIAPLPYERAASIAMLDERLEPPGDFEKNDRDFNQYTWGRIGTHHVVIASLPVGEPGVSVAAATAASMLASLPSVRIGLLVGVGAGVPHLEQGYDIRLGDVVVSQPQGTTGGVIQYDLRFAIDGLYERARTLNMPPAALRSGLAKLQAEHEMAASAIPTYLAAMRTNYPQMAKHSRNKPGYVHQGPEQDCYFASGDLITRDVRDSLDPEIHYGTIASGNTLIHDADRRNLTVAQLDGLERILCLDAEAAGLMNHFPCLVIRGISGYADGVDNRKWERYAAATAAAFAKELLGCLDSQQVFKSPKIGHLQRQMDGVQEDVRKLIEYAEQQDRDYHTADVMMWLSPAEPSVDFNRAIRQRQDGTGSWLLDRVEYADWKRNRNTSIWLHGKPGSGKTVLSSTVIEDVRRFDSDKVIFFYFDFRDTSKQSFSGMVRSLMAQLYRQSAASQTHLDRLFVDCNEHTEPQGEALVRTFQDMIAEAKGTVIVLDALDECTTRKELLKWLSACLSRATPLLMTSRTEHDFELILDVRPHLCTVISLQQQAVEFDILTFVTRELATKEGFQRWRSRPSVSRMIQEKLMEKTSGMFRWAACQLDVLEACLDLASLERTLSSLPDGLNEAYDQIISRIPDPHRPNATRLLQFLAYSEEPLGLAEAVDVIAIDPDQPQAFAQSDRMPIPEEVVLFCPNLIEVTRPWYTDSMWLNNRWGLGVADKSNDILCLTHLSVREYLRSGKVATEFQRQMEEVHARGCILRVCLAYLKAASQVRRPQLLPLHDFAAEQWVGHARFVEHSEPLLDAICQFLANKDVFEYWEEHYLNTLQSGKRGGFHTQDLEHYGFFIDAATTTARLRHRPGPDALHYACLGGLVATCARLIETGLDVNAPGRIFDIALQSACVGGYEAVVRVLLDAGSQIEYREDRKRSKVDFRLQPRRTGYRQPFYIACSEGHAAVVSLLLSRGADPRRYPLALRAASGAGYEGVVRLLLDNGADVDAHDTEGDALSTASEYGREQVVRMLLERGAQPNSHFCDALTRASGGGHLSVVSLLLRNGAQVDTPDVKVSPDPAPQDSPWRDSPRPNSPQSDLPLPRLPWSGSLCFYGSYGDVTALQAAALGGHEAIVRLLLDSGVDVNATKQPSGSLTALQAALLWHCQNIGEIGLVRLLLEHEADANAPGPEFEGNALHLACADNASETMIRLLLDHGADVNALGGEYGSALQAACTNKDSKEIVQLLLDRGAAVNAKGGAFGSALQAACASDGSPKVVQLLLDSGADINAEGGRYGSALIACCASVQMASPLDIGLYVDDSSTRDLGKEENDPGIQNLEEETQGRGDPINWKVDEQDRTFKVVRILLDKGADVHLRGSEYGSALLASCAQESVPTAVVKLLIDRGAQFQDPDPKYGSVLVAVCASAGGSEREREAKVRLLLAAGADPYTGGFAFRHVSWVPPRYRAWPEATTGTHTSLDELLLVDPSGAPPSSEGNGSERTQVRLGDEQDEDDCLERVSVDRLGSIASSRPQRSGEEVYTYGSALEAACDTGHSRIVQILLDRGDVPMNVLEAAVTVSEGQQSILQMLEDFKNGKRSE